MAQRWADKCIYDHGDMEGSANISPFQPEVGQNMAMGNNPTWAGSAGAIEPIEYWHNEVQDYDYNSITCRPGKKCGHYTQVNG